MGRNSPPADADDQLQPPAAALQRLTRSDLESLGRTEQFLLAVGRIPRLAQRLHVIAFMRSFDAERQSLQGRLTLVADATEQVVRSEALVAFLEVCSTVQIRPMSPRLKFGRSVPLLWWARDGGAYWVLHADVVTPLWHAPCSGQLVLETSAQVCLRLGNFMNRGTAYANAKGFSMGSMQQLVNIKSVIDRSTLMEVLVERLATMGAAPPTDLEERGDVGGEQGEESREERGGLKGDLGGERGDVPGEQGDEADGTAGQSQSLVDRLCEELHLLRSASRENLQALNEVHAEIRAGAIRVRSELEELPPLTMPPEVIDGTLGVRMQCRAAALLTVRVTVAGKLHWALYPTTAGPTGKAVGATPSRKPLASPQAKPNVGSPGAKAKGDARRFGADRPTADEVKKGSGFSTDFYR